MNTSPNDNLDFKQSTDISTDEVEQTTPDPAE